MFRPCVSTVHMEILTGIDNKSDTMLGIISGSLSYFCSA